MAVANAKRKACGRCTTWLCEAFHAVCRRCPDSLNSTPMDLEQFGLRQRSQHRRSDGQLLDADSCWTYRVAAAELCCTLQKASMETKRDDVGLQCYDCSDPLNDSSSMIDSRRTSALYEPTPVRWPPTKFFLKPLAMKPSWRRAMVWIMCENIGGTLRIPSAYIWELFIHSPWNLKLSTPIPGVSCRSSKINERS